MKGRRLDRINELVRTELGSLLLHETRDPRLSQVVSITAVDVSADLGSARVYVSVLGGEQEKRESLRGLRTASGFLRRKLSQRVGLRNTPELRFLLDDSIEQGARVLDLMREAAPSQSSKEETRSVEPGRGSRESRAAPGDPAGGESGS